MPDYLAAAAKTALVYAFALALVRVGALRLFGRMSSLDVVVSITLGSLLSRGITGGASIEATTASCSLLVLLHWLVATLTSRSHALADLLKREPVLLVEDGRFLRANMRKAHVSEGDVLEGVRQSRGLDSVELVKRAYLERNGEISVIPKD